MKLKTKFQDEDFELGEVVEANIYYGGSGRVKIIAEPTKGGMITFYFESLKELNEMFEDAPEEPKEYWFINSVGGAIRPSDTTDWEQQDAIHHKEIGNYFETEEEAEKAVEKLKAFKRLRDKGFRFEGWEMDGTIWFETKQDEQEWSPKYRDDLDLLFGGEE